jgi:dihydrofolate reductase
MEIRSSLKTVKLAMAWRTDDPFVTVNSGQNACITFKTCGNATQEPASISDLIISLIVAVAENGVIGANGGLPWRLSSDLKTFRRLTLGKPIVMGRRTFQSIGKPLDGRDNIVVTRDTFFESAGVSVVASVNEAITLARVLASTRGADEIMIIGGADLYAATLAIADRVYLTRVHAEPAGDRHFPKLDADVWTQVASEALPRTERDEFSATLLIFERKS